MRGCVPSGMILQSIWLRNSYRTPPNKSLDRSHRQRASHQSDPVLSWHVLAGGGPVNSAVGALLYPMTRNWIPILVIVGALGLWGLSELFPPWKYEDGNTSAIRSAGYHFYKSPPAVKSPEEMRALFQRREGQRPLSIHVQRNHLQLMAQRIVLFWLALNLLILSLGRGSLLVRVLLWMCFAFGGAVAAWLLWRVLV
jgi:hypothetical protein